MGQGLGHWKMSRRISNESVQLGATDRVSMSPSLHAHLPRNPFGSWGASWAVDLPWGSVHLHIVGQRKELKGDYRLLTPMPKQSRLQAAGDSGSFAGRRQQGWGLWAPGKPGREGSGEGRGMEIHKEDLLGRSDAQRRLMKQIPRWVSEQLPKSLFAFKFPQGGGRLV